LRYKNFGVEESFRKSYGHLSLPKIEFSALASTTGLKVRLVVQCQHIKCKGADGVGDYDDAFSPVSAASGFRTILSLATQLEMFTDHVDISESQAFVQGELLPGDGHNGNVYECSPPDYEEDSRYIYRLLKPLYGMPSAARAWHTTMSALLEREGCETMGFEKSIWRVVIDGHRILLGSHIDDFVIACAGKSLTRSESVFWRHLRALRRRDFAIAWILGYSTAQHTYETKHSPFKRRLRPQPQTGLPPSLPWHCRKSWLHRHYDPPRFCLVVL